MNTYICITSPDEGLLTLPSSVTSIAIKDIMIVSNVNHTNTILRESNTAGYTYLLTGDSTDILALMLAVNIRLIQVDIPFHFTEPVILSALIIEHTTDACHQLNYTSYYYPFYTLLQSRNE